MERKKQKDFINRKGLPLDDIKIFRPREVAEILGKSQSWVYAHAEELGAVRIGGSVFFTESGLKGVFENAAQDEKRKMQSGGHDQRKPDNKIVQYPRRSKKVRSQGKSQADEFETDPARHGIANIFQQIC